MCLDTLAKLLAKADLRPALTPREENVCLCLKLRLKGHLQIASVAGTFT